MAAPHREGLARAVRARLSIRHSGLVPARVTRDEDGRLRIRLHRQAAPTLDQVLASGPLTQEDALRLVSAVASAVEALRRADLVARDLRPSRILLVSPGQPMLADTGIPLELVPRTLPTDDPEAAFRAPEEVDAHTIDARSNVYSLGRLLQCTLGKSGNGTTEEVDDVIARATAARPEDRHAGPREFIIDAAAAFGLRLKVRSEEPERDSPDGPSRPSEDNPAPRSPARGRPAPLRAPSRATQPEHRRRRPPRSGDPAQARGAREPAPAGPQAPKRRAPEHATDVSAQSARGIAWPRVTLPRFRAPQLPTLSGLGGYLRPPALPGTRVPSQPSMRALGVVIALAACVIGGLLLAKLVAGEADEGGPRLSSSALSVQLPGGWDATRVDREPSIAIAGPVAAAPLGESGTGLVAGRVEDAAELDKRLSGEAAQRTVVTLGRLQAWRYSGLRPERGLAAVAFLAPTTEGALLVICHARRAVARARLHECEGIASAISVRGARPAALAGVAAAEREVGAVMEELREERRARRRELGGARRAAAQARAARALEASYHDAAESLESSSAIAGEADSLVQSLRAAARAYGDLAAAATDGDRPRYRAASRLIAEREAAVERRAAEPLSA